MDEIITLYDTIELTVNNKTIHSRKNDSITTGQIGNKIKLTFEGTTWSDLDITVIFKVDNNIYNLALLDNITTIPWELCKEEFLGRVLYLGLRGTKNLGMIDYTEDGVTKIGYHVLEEAGEELVTNYYRQYSSGVYSNQILPTDPAYETIQIKDVDYRTPYFRLGVIEAGSSPDGSQQSGTPSPTPYDEAVTRSREWAIGPGKSSENPSATNNSRYWSSTSALWAVGPDGQTGTPSATNNAEYWAEQAAEEYSKIGDSVLQAKSWAVGPNGSEERGSDTINAKKFCELSNTYQQNAFNSATLAKAYAVEEGSTEGKVGYQDNAEYYKKQADASAILANSWAIGGTSSRQGEDTNNSKYYSEQAAASFTKLESMTATAHGLTPENPPTVTKTEVQGVVNLDFGIPKGNTGDAAGFGTPTASIDANIGTPEVTITSTGPDTKKVFDFAFKNLKGETGNGILKIERTSGTGAAGTIDTYTITYTNGTTFDYYVYNGADGLGVGDMTKHDYDTVMVSGTATNPVYDKGGIPQYIDSLEYTVEDLRKDWDEIWNPTEI